MEGQQDWLGNLPFGGLDSSSEAVFPFLQYLKPKQQLKEMKVEMKLLETIVMVPKIRHPSGFNRR